MKLRKLLPSDAKRMLEWMTLPDTREYFQFDQSKLSEEKCLEFIRNSYTKQNKHFAVVDENDAYLGTVSLKDIDEENSRAEFAIGLHPDSRGRGAGRMAMVEILKIAFDELGLNRVFLTVLDNNERAIHLYESLGFSHEGTLRQHVKTLHGFSDWRVYGILKSEWGQKK